MNFKVQPISSSLLSLATYQTPSIILSFQAPKPVDPLAKVTGLTEKVVLKPKTGAHEETYKSPEYFLYGRHSYHEAEIELGPYRCPQPNANRK